MSFAWLPLGVLAALAAPIAPAAPMPPRPALCILEQNGVTAFAGRCRLHPAADGGAWVPTARGISCWV